MVKLRHEYTGIRFRVKNIKDRLTLEIPDSDGNIRSVRAKIYYLENID